jgi:hypothetical protein
VEVHNRDLFPGQDLQDLYRAISPIIVNPLVDDQFNLHEEAAKKAKAAYHVRGRLGMLLVLSSAVFTVAEALVIPAFPGLDQLSIAFVVLGLVGLGIQIQLILSKKKEEWLVHRFAAERLRSIKFQAYRLAMIVRSVAELARAADSFYQEAIASLNSELNMGRTAISQFSPAKSVVKVAKVTTPVDETIHAAALKAYRQLRMLYQRGFAAAEVDSLASRQRVGYTAADILYLLGASLSVIALLCKVFSADAMLSNWIDFLAVFSFIVGLIKTLMDNASLAETSKVRYEDYVQAIDECDAELDRENAKLPEVVWRFERIVLDELRQFCQSASQISYRL